MFISMLLVFNGAFGSRPDITVIGKIEIPEYKIECDPSHRPLVIEFLTDDRTECAIETSKGRCSYFDFEQAEQGKVVLASDRKPFKDQTFGCEMIFNNTDDLIKVHCSVKFNGTDFLQLPKQFTHFNDFSNTWDEEKNITTTAQDHRISDFVVLVVVCGLLLGLQICTVTFLVYRRLDRKFRVESPGGKGCRSSLLTHVPVQRSDKPIMFTRISAIKHKSSASSNMTSSIMGITTRPHMQTLHWSKFCS